MKEPAVSYRWTGWVWEITSWCLRLQFRGIYRIYLKWLKQIRKMSTCNRLDLQLLGSWLTMPKNFPGTGIDSKLYIFIYLYNDNIWLCVQTTNAFVHSIVNTLWSVVYGLLKETKFSLPLLITLASLQPRVWPWNGTLWD